MRTSILVFVLSGCALGQLPSPDLEVSLTPAAGKYCHIVRFPGWKIRPFDDQGGRLLFNSYSDYEFRVEGLLGTKFLIAGFTEFVGHNYYTSDRYIVDLSHPTAPLGRATHKAWDLAAVVPFVHKGIFVPGQTLPGDQLAKLHGFTFTKTGKIWGQPSEDAARLSPDQAWLVLQSWTQGDEHVPIRVFFDFFNADTGNKLFTLEGTFTRSQYDDPDIVDPDSLLGKTGWVTERYFIIPLGRHKERCLVCDFGRKNPPRGESR